MHAQKPYLGTLLNTSHPLARGLVGYWLMNEGVGNKVCDLSKNNNAGTFGGDTFWGAGRFGPTTVYGGTDDIINCGTEKVLQPTSVTLIVSLTRNTQADSHGTIAAQTDGSKGYAMYVTQTTRELWWAHSRNWAVNSTGYFVTNPAIVALAYDEFAGTRVYADGMLIDTDGNTGALDYDAGTVFTIGMRLDSVGLDFAGRVDFVIVYNRALSHQEIAQLYRDPFCMFKQVPIELWAAATAGAAPPAGIPIFRRRRECA